MTIIQKPAHATRQSKTKTKKIGFVLHWMVGNLQSTTYKFQSPAVPLNKDYASAHYGIGDNGEVYQYVHNNFIAYHAGNSTANQNYIGIEHAGGTELFKNGPRKKPTEACHQASIELLTQLCTELEIHELIRGKNIFKHSEIVPTQCCGSLDIDYITQQVNNNLKNNNMSLKDYSKNFDLKSLESDVQNALNMNDLDFVLNRLRSVVNEKDQAKNQLKQLQDSVSQNSVNSDNLTDEEKKQFLNLVTKLIN